MPKNWKTYKLENIAKISGGKRMPKGQNLVEFETDHPYIRVRDMNTRTIRKSDLLYVPDSAFDKISRYTVSENDIIISVVGTIGNIAIIDGNISGANLTENCNKITELQNLDSSFLYYFLISNIGQGEITKGVVGSTQPKLPLYSIKDINLNIPPLPEQRAIASILSTIDDKIENNLAMNKTLEDMAMALYKHWFVDFGPFQEGKFIDSELGKIPEGWEVKELGELVKILGGYAFKGKDFKDVGESVIKIKNISNNLVSIEGSNCIAVQVAEKTNPKFQISPGSFLVAMTGAEVGKVGVVPNYGRRMWLNQRVGMISKPAFKYADILVGIFLQSTEGYEIIQNLAYGSAQPNISSSGIESISIVIPNDLSIIIDELNQMNNWHLQRISNYTENQTLTQIRDTLLPKLISGEVRLKEFEKEITAAL
tara:strand:+ start:3640 stop:4914 length:1275 start_codon:yes stop_codon:yes gene_type:complete